MSFTNEVNIGVFAQYLNTLYVGLALKGILLSTPKRAYGKRLFSPLCIHTFYFNNGASVEREPVVTIPRLILLY